MTPARRINSSRRSALAAAVRAGDTRRIRRAFDQGASVNDQSSDTGEMSLHLAVRSSGDAAAAVETLLRLGCRIDRTSKDGATPAGLARAIGRPELAELIETLAPQCGPRWMREARLRDIVWYVFFESKALGLGFDPNDIDYPVLWEGSYMGFGWPTSAADALAWWERDFSRDDYALEATRWFVPFMEKLASGDEFGLDELERAAPRFTIAYRHQP